MGKKLSWEDAEKLGSLSNDNGSIYARPNNYGYKYNLNNPVIKQLYERYKKKKGLPNFPLSDKERHNFEQHVHKFLNQNAPINVKN